MAAEPCCNPRRRFAHAAVWGVAHHHPDFIAVTDHPLRFQTIKARPDLRRPDQPVLTQLVGNRLQLQVQLLTSRVDG